MDVDNDCCREAYLPMSIDKDCYQEVCLPIDIDKLLLAIAHPDFKEELDVEFYKRFCSSK